MVIFNSFISHSQKVTPPFSYGFPMDDEGWMTHDFRRLKKRWQFERYPRLSGNLQGFRQRQFVGALRGGQLHDRLRVVQNGRWVLVLVLVAVGMVIVIIY